MLLLALGFMLQVAWVTSLWRWDESPLVNSYIAALLASFGVGSLLLAWSGNPRAAAGGALSLVILGFGFAAHVAAGLLAGEALGLGVHAAVLAGVAALAAGTLRSSLHAEASRERQLPLALRVFASLFALLVLVCGAALLLDVPGIMPWQVSPQSGLLIGWVLVGLSAEYAYVAMRGQWPDAEMLLVGFLVYCAVFALPLLWNFGTVDSDHWPSQVGNVTVLALSAPLAIYFLTVSRGSAQVAPTDSATAVPEKTALLLPQQGEADQHGAGRPGNERCDI
jgi:hypothetical protein